MSKYSVFWASGSYPERQEAANKAGCVCYVEHHFNALEYDRPETTADNPALCLVAHNASERSKNWAADYCQRVSDTFGFPSAGVIQVQHRSRGDYNLRFTVMPAILVEPMFVSDPTQAKIAKSLEGQRVLARILFDSIRAAFPDGGKVALSIGHKGQPGRAGDRGAPVYDGGWEADLAERVLLEVAKLIRATARSDLDVSARVARLEERVKRLEEARS